MKAVPKNSAEIAERLKLMRFRYRLNLVVMAITDVTVIVLAAETKYKEFAFYLFIISTAYFTILFCRLKCPFCNEPVLRFKIFDTYFYSLILPSKCRSCSNDLREHKNVRERSKTQKSYRK
jgi:hypothetical protein